MSVVSSTELEMRLGLLGPALGQEDALRRAARFLLEDLKVERAIYLGTDHLLDEVVRDWAEDLVGGDPDEAAIWERATYRCLEAGPEEIDEFIAAERERQGLRVFESLPGERTRAIELLSGKVAVMIYDKAFFDEEDILPATLLVYGKSRDALVKRIGRRWFLSPGSLTKNGIMMLEDPEDGIYVTLYDNQCRQMSREHLSVDRGAKLRISGAT